MNTQEKHAPGSPPPRTRATPEETATRCPYCHDSCASTEDVRVCSSCLSRHHTECWNEAGGCSSCGATEPLARIGEGDAAEQPAGLAGFFQEHKGVLLRWELLRIPYNATLFGVCAVMLGAKVLAPALFIEGVVSALVANVCYSLGPALEVYLRTLGAKQKWVGPLIYFVGLMLSILVTVMACLMS